MVELSEPGYRAIKIEALLRFGRMAQVEVFLRLSESKYVKVVHREEPKDTVLQKYYDRGIKEVFLTPDEFLIFTTTVRQELLEKIEAESRSKDPAPNFTASPDEKDQSKVRQLEGAQQVLKAIFASGRIDDDAKEISKAVANETIKIVKRTNIFLRFREFQKNCSSEYMHAMLTSYVTSLMIDKFNWGNEQVKQKVALAAVLCDVLLSPDEIEIMHDPKKNREDYSKNLQYHPIETARLLANESKFYSSETLQIIEQHHEQPTGNGYPKGLDYSKITVLTAIYIVASFFIERMFDKGFNPDDKDWNKEKMGGIMIQIKNKYYNGNFRKASEVLEDLYGTEMLKLDI